MLKYEIIGFIHLTCIEVRYTYELLRSCLVLSFLNCVFYPFNYKQNTLVNSYISLIKITYKI